MKRVRKRKERYVNNQTKVENKRNEEQAGADLGQAQPQLC